jgi:hypothetical protein
VFVSSDPEDLQSGSEWPKVIQENLKAAQVLLVLATERGLSSRWVWFEAGAAWRADLPIVPCCLGRMRAGGLPPPFFSYQACNIDEGAGLLDLLQMLARKFEVDPVSPDIHGVTADLIALDAKAHEADGVGPGLDAERRREVDRGLGRLAEEAKEALSLLLLHGNLTDAQALEMLRERGFAVSSRIGIFSEIARDTNFVVEARPPGPGERLLGYHGRWAPNPNFKPLLEELLAEPAHPRALPRAARTPKPPGQARGPRRRSEATATGQGELAFGPAAASLPESRRA